MRCLVEKTIKKAKCNLLNDLLKRLLQLFVIFLFNFLQQKKNQKEIEMDEIKLQEANRIMDAKFAEAISDKSIKLIVFHEIKSKI